MAKHGCHVTVIQLHPSGTLKVRARVICCGVGSVWVAAQRRQEMNYHVFLQHSSGAIFSTRLSCIKEVLTDICESDPDVLSADEALEASQRCATDRKASGLASAMATMRGLQLKGAVREQTPRAHTTGSSRRERPDLGLRDRSLGLTPATAAGAMLANQSQT